MFHQLRDLELFSNKTDINRPSCEPSESEDTYLHLPKSSGCFNGEIPFDPSASAMGDINVLKTTASDLKDMLSKGLITSRAIVKAYLRQIKRHNSQGMTLNALIDVAPEESLLGIADILDAERAAGNLRGDYHGIPIVLKVRCYSLTLCSRLYAN